MECIPSNFTTKPQLKPIIMNAKANLLVVDDHAELLEFIADDLNEDYHITTSTNGNEALNLLTSEYFDLIISDVMMPEMDGYELCQKIKENIAYAHSPVILLTAKKQYRIKNSRPGIWC